MIRTLIAVLFGLGLAGPTLAQVTAAPVVTGYWSTSGCSYGLTTCFVQFGAGGGGGGGSATPFAPISPTVTLTAGVSSSRVALTVTGSPTQVLVYNSDSTNTAFVRLGNGSVTAAVTDIPVPPKTTIPIAFGANVDIAGITASSTALLYITSGTGNIASGWGGGSGGGSSATGAPYAFTPVAPSQLGVTVSTATAPTIPSTAKVVYAQTLNSCVNWRDDGTAPTTSAGVTLCPGAVARYTGTSATQVQFIVQGSPSVAPVMNFYFEF